MCKGTKPCVEERCVRVYIIGVRLSEVSYLKIVHTYMFVLCKDVWECAV